MLAVAISRLETLRLDDPLEGERPEQQRAGEDGGPVRLDAADGQAVGDGGQDQRADQDPGQAAPAAGEGDAGQRDRGEGVEDDRRAGRRVRLGDDRGGDQAAERREQPGDHEAEHLVAVAVDAGAAYRLGVAADRHQPDPVPGAGQEDRADEEDRADDEDRGGDAREVAGGEVAVGAHELELGQPGERVAARDDRGQAGQHRQGADGDDDRVEPAQRDQAVDQADHDAAAERRPRARSTSRSRWSAASRRHSWPAPRCPAGTGRGRRS